MQIETLISSIKLYLVSSSHALSDYKNDRKYQLLTRLYRALSYISCISSALLIALPILFTIYSIIVLLIVEFFRKESDPISVESTVRALGNFVASNIHSYFVLFIVVIVSIDLYAVFYFWLERTRDRLLSESLAKFGDSSNIIDGGRNILQKKTSSTSTLLRLQLYSIIELFEPSNYFKQDTIEFHTAEKLLDLVFYDWYGTISKDSTNADFIRLEKLLLRKQHLPQDLKIIIADRKMIATYFIDGVARSKEMYVPYEIF